MSAWPTGEVAVYDKDREGHYNLISALHTAIRGSDPQASLYYLARMLVAGEELLWNLARTHGVEAAVAADVAAIRRQVFEGEDPGAAWQLRFGWSNARPSFLVVNPHITVQLANATAARETVYPVSTLSPLFMTTEAMTLLVNSLNALGEENPERRSVARVPVEMRNFLGTHLPLEMGMLASTGITSFASIPNVCSVVFTNAERTRANVEIRTSSSGGTLVMEKTAAAWRVVSVGDSPECPSSPQRFAHEVLTSGRGFVRVSGSRTAGVRAKGAQGRPNRSGCAATWPGHHTYVCEPSSCSRAQRHVGLPQRRPCEASASSVLPERASCHRVDAASW